MRLLVVTTVPKMLEAFLLPFGTRLRDAGWQVDGMAAHASQSGPCRSAFDRVHDAPWSRNPLHPANLLRAPSFVRRVVAEGNYDIVHVHSPVAGFVVRYALSTRPARGPRVIYTAHGFHFHGEGGALRNLVFRNLERLAGRWTDRLVVVNEADHKAALDHKLAPPGKIVRIPAIWLDRQRFSRSNISLEATRTFRETIGVSPADFLFTIAAEFIPRKRHADVLRAFHELSRADTHLALAGEGPLRAEILLLAQSLGIADRVHFLGQRSDMPAILASSDAVLLGSEHEGMPACILEAFCLGTPVIGSDVRGTRELLSNGCGILVGLGDIAGFTNAMRRVVTEPERAKAMATRARERWGSYSIDSTLESYVHLYKATVPSDQKQSDRRLLVVVTIDVMAWVLLRLWLAGLQKAGFEVHIACARGRYYDQLGADGFVMHPVGMRRTFNPFAHIVPFSEVTALLRREKFTAILTHSPVAAAVGRLAAAGAGVSSIIYTVHGFYFHDRMPAFLRWPLIALEWFFGRWTDGFMFVSDEDRRTAHRLGISGANARICTISNGVDLSIFHPDINRPSGPLLRQQHSIPQDRPVVGIVGRIVKEKGYREFLEMARTLTRAGIDATYLVIGDSLPSDRDQFGPVLRRQVSEAGLDDRFVFTGMTDRVPEYLPLMDVFVLPSYREGFPRSVLEAMATGLPVVATDIRGCREAVVEGVTGHIVPPRDADALAHAIQSLLTNPERRRTMGENARRIAVEKYDHRVVSQRFSDFVEQSIVASPSTNPSLGTTQCLLIAIVATALCIAGLYLLPVLLEFLLQHHETRFWPIIIAGDAPGCIIIGALWGWRFGAFAYLALSLLEALLFSAGLLTVGGLIWVTNFVPTLIVLARLLPRILRGNNWRA